MSIEESQYFEMVTSMYSMPLTVDVKGNIHRSDFVYIDIRTGIPLWYLWDSGKSECITPGNEPIKGLIALHDEKHWVVFTKDVGGTENYAVYFLDYSTKEMSQITDTIGRINGIFWDTDDTWIVTGCDLTEYYIKVVSRNGDMRTLFSTDQQILIADYDKKRTLVAAAVGRGPGTKIGIIDVKSGNVDWISESDTSEDSFPFFYSEKGYLGYTTDVSGKLEIVIVSLEPLKEMSRMTVPGDISFLPGEGNIEWVNENTIFVAVAKDAQISPHLVTVDGTWSPPLVDISVVLSTCTKDGPVWIGSSFSQPLSVQIFKNGKVTTLIEPEYTFEYISGESHWYTSFDGRKIQGWLLRNPDPDAPLVITCHGGPNYATLNMFGDLGLQEVVQAGYHVFAPNFRGSTTFGNEFRNLNIGDIGGGDLQDVLYGARYAMEVLQVKRKPFIVGGSYGGFLTLQALTTQPDEWGGGVAIVPWVDLLESHELGDAHYKALDVYLLGGTPQEKPDLYRERSPITHLDKLKSPVLIVAGENDSRCPLQPVEKFYEKAKRLNLPVELEILKDEGHGPGRISDVFKMLVFELEFLKTLRGK
jgi:pimeloyl-ACP methyl ester carboxylesterase